MSSTPISARVDPKLAAELEKLAASTDRPKSWHVEQALSEYLRVQAWQIAGIEKALASIKAGKTIDHATVVKEARAYARRLDADRVRKTR